MRPALNRLTPALAAVAGGAFLAAGFPPLGWALLVPIGVAALVWSAHSAHTAIGAAASSGLGGLVFFAILLQWLTVVGADAWLLLSAFCSLWFALLGLATWAATRLRWWPLWVAGIWVLQEALRSRIPLGGFGWGRLAFSQAYSAPGAYAAIGGAVLVTFAVALTGCLLASLLMRRSQTVVATLATISGAAVVWSAALLIPLPTEGQSNGGPATARIAVIQGSVPPSGDNSAKQRETVLMNHVRATEALAAKVAAGQAVQPQAVIWPENSSDLDPYANPAAATAISRATVSIGAPILLGAVISDPHYPGRLLNVGVVWNPASGPGERYAKRHPVPFGEYVPARDLLAPLVGRFDRIPFDFNAGEAPGVLQVGPVRLGDVICFEVSDDRIVRDAVLTGGRALSVQTNNATFASPERLAGTAQPEQQAAMSVLRSLEHGRSSMVAATSGVSMIVNPDGTVAARAEMFEQAVLEADVPLRDSISLSDRLGAWPELLLATAGGAALVVAIRLHSKARRTAASESVEAGPRLPVDMR